MCSAFGSEQEFWVLDRIGLARKVKMYKALFYISRRKTLHCLARPEFVISKIVSAQDLGMSGTLIASLRNIPNYLNIMNNFYNALTLSLGILLPCLADAAIITNGDFETGDLSGWSSFVTSNGVASPRVSLFSVNGQAMTYAAQFQVGEYVYTGLQEGGGISQMFSVSQGVFNISAGIASQSSPDFGNLEGGIFSLILDGVVVNSFDFGEANANEIKRSTLTYSGMLTEGVHELAILATRSFLATNTPFQYIDNIQVQAATEAIPEPATVGLFAIGLFGLVSFKRRSQR